MWLTTCLALNFLNELKACTKTLHYKCRNDFYPDRTRQIQRLRVPNEMVPWEVEWSNYNPPSYTSKRIKGQIWADPDIDDGTFTPSWHTVDGVVNRVSHQSKKYNIVNNYPLNPMGRTGLKGRGLLGRWGPNHAADPIVTRWKRNREDGHIERDNETCKPILQFVAIKRADSRQWAIPGGMVEPGEHVSVTLKREFMEEAMNFLSKSEAEKVKLKEQIENTFKNGKQMYRGYVDDPRNTDNAWTETVVFLFHDEDRTSVGALPLHAGDEAVGVMWMDVNRHLRLYAKNCTILEKVVHTLDAHW